MKFRLIYSQRAQTELMKLGKSSRIEALKKIEKLEKDADLGKPLRNDMKGARRLRVGKYRIVYRIIRNDILITKVGHRKDVYA